MDIENNNVDRKQLDRSPSDISNATGAPISDTNLPASPTHDPYATEHLEEYIDSPNQHHTHNRGPKLAAERIFDAGLYGAWNYVAQAGTSVAAAMWFHEGSGKPYFDKSAEWLGEHVMSKITSKTGAAAAAEAHTPLMFVSLITVGSLFIPPMQYAEKHKAHYVSKINDWLNSRRSAKGDGPDSRELAEQQAEIKAIASAPLQSSKELWIGRGLGLAGNFVAQRLIGGDNDLKMKNAFADGVSHGLNTVGLKSLGNSETMKSVSRMAFLDYGYSLISSNIVYAYGHYFNPPEHEEEKSEQAAKTDHDTPKAEIQLSASHPIIQNQAKLSELAMNEQPHSHASAHMAKHSNHTERAKLSHMDASHIGGAI